MIPAEWFDDAQRRIQGHVKSTPLTHDAERGLFLKWENRQTTGSFKARGAINKVLTLEAWERDAGLVAASAGNHGQGVALAAQITGAKAEIFVPAQAVQAKVDAIRALGGEVRKVEGSYGDTEDAAKAYASENHKVFISPYNDGQVIAGQGTAGLEVLEQLRTAFATRPEKIASWILPLSGGGLICGCAAAVAARGWRPRFVGVQPAESAFTHSLFHRGTQEGVADHPTLADGLSGSIDPASITIPMLRQYVSDVVTVTEAELEETIAFAWWNYSEQIEGSAAAALAAALRIASAEAPNVVVITGGNIQPEVFETILQRHPEKARL